MAGKSETTEAGTAASPKNPSGASKEQIEAGEMVGVARGPDVDGSFHVYEFTDPLTGEPYEEKADKK